MGIDGWSRCNESFSPSKDRQYCRLLRYSMIYRIQWLYTGVLWVRKTVNEDVGPLVCAVIRTFDLLYLTNCLMIDLIPTSLVADNIKAVELFEPQIGTVTITGHFGVAGGWR